MKGLKQADWLAAAREFLAELPDDELRETPAYKIEYAFRLTRWNAAEELLIAEKLKRGLITMSDLTPDQRRRAVNRENLDIHAVASGPIMDAANLYCPLGKISLAEAKAREIASILPDEGEANAGA